jgi:serine/threonine protein phosphatase PrpC
MIIRGEQIICGNAGDSRAIIGRRKMTGWEAIKLTNDHKPENIDERHIIEAAGGIVASYQDTTGEHIGPLRVWVPNSTPQVPGLAMTRSLGDKVASSIGVSAKPELTIHQRTQTDKFIVIASDGIWEFLSNDYVVNKVAGYISNGRIEEAADRLLKDAVA